MTIDTPARQRDLHSRAARRGWWRDSLIGGVWLVGAAAVSLFMLEGGLVAAQAIDYVYSLGRVAGIVAAVLVMTQILLVSRAPWVERAYGHDRTTAAHTTLGKYAFVLMVAHAGMISITTAQYEGNSLLEQPAAFADVGWYLSTAQLGLGLFAVVVATSLYAVRRRWRYERWHAVHLLVYISIALVIPHQFLEGSTFRDGGLAWWFWLVLYAVAIGSFLGFRVIRPLVLWRRHDVRVADVTRLSDGSATIVMTGKGLDRLGARPGQFFLWRFLDRDRWREAHPFSLSSAPTANALRITVKPVGDLTERLAEVAPGTRVMVEGPLGVFSDATRTQPGLVLVSAGIGVTPLRAMLEAHQEDAGPCTVIVRARSHDEAPLLDEIHELAQQRGATVHVLVGPRGEGWAPAEQPATLAELVPTLAQCDVYVCGPPQWARAVEADARAAGCPPESVHREQFSW